MILRVHFSVQGLVMLNSNSRFPYLKHTVLHKQSLVIYYGDKHHYISKYINYVAATLHIFKQLEYASRIKLKCEHKGENSSKVLI